MKMLELIRGKRLVFVGDSINRNQWESMLCMLRTALSDPSRVYETRGQRITKNRGNYRFYFPVCIWTWTSFGLINMGVNNFLRGAFAGLSL